MSDQITHLVIVRGAALDPDGISAEVRLGFIGEPTEEELSTLRDAMAALFSDSFGELPARYGYAVLPWVTDIDDPEDG